MEGRTYVLSVLVNGVLATTTVEVNNVDVAALVSSKRNRLVSVFKCRNISRGNTKCYIVINIIDFNGGRG
jgi:hypothetical protein